MCVACELTVGISVCYQKHVLQHSKVPTLGNKYQLPCALSLYINDYLPLLSPSQLYWYTLGNTMWV